MITGADVLRNVAVASHADWTRLYGACRKTARDLGDMPQGPLPHYTAADLAAQAISRAKQANPGCTPDQAIRIALTV